MSKKGFIVLHRSLLDWEWYSDKNTKILFLHLLLTANFEDKKWRGVDIKRGQVISGRIELAKSTGLTEREIRTSLSKLKTTNELTIKATSKFSIFTLTNYGLYQDIAEKNDQQKDHPKDQRKASKRPASDQQATTTKPLKPLNNENNPQTPEAGGEVFKSFVGGIGELEKLLDQKSNDDAKKNCEGWDMFFIKGEYIKFIKRHGLPDNIRKAFPAFCLKITKGKRP